MLFQTDLLETLANAAWTIIGIIGVVVFVLVVAYFKTLVVVPLNEYHVVIKKDKKQIFDGQGRYTFFNGLYSRTIIPKFVLDVEPPLIKIHDKDQLPLGIEISCKVKISDPARAGESLRNITLESVRKVVEDTIMSAVRSIAMTKNVLEIMKEREAIEIAVNDKVMDALGKLGLYPSIFDIKNISDIENNLVIRNLERVKIAELARNARVSEAEMNAGAEKKEAEAKALTQIVKEASVRDQMKAKYERERENAQQEHESLTAQMRVRELEVTKSAEIKRKEVLLQAQSQAEAIELKAKAESEAAKMKMAAQAEGLRMKEEAEAQGLKMKADAMKAYTEAGKEGMLIQALNILSQAQIGAAEKIAMGLAQNSKIIYLPSEGGLLNYVPKIDSFLESGAIDKILTKLNDIRGLTITEKKTAPAKPQ